MRKTGPTFEAIKQQFSKRRRKEQLQKKFQFKRQQLSQEIVQKQNQIFNSIASNINQQNYQQHRITLSDYAKSQKYSYELLPIVFLAYEYLLINPMDSPSWEIVTFMSYYEDFQIPQTQDFAIVTKQFVIEKQELASEFILNISTLPKCSLLCCRLIDLDILESIQAILQSIELNYSKQCLSNEGFLITNKSSFENTIYNLLSALSYLFVLKPALEPNLLRKICEIQNLPTYSNKFLSETHVSAIYKLMENAIENFSQNKDILSLLMSQFFQSINDCFFIYQNETLRFIYTCLRNHLTIEEKLMKNIFLCIKSSNNKSRQLTISILQELLEYNTDKQTMQIEQSREPSKSFSGLISNTLPSFEQFSQMFSPMNTNQQRMIAKNDSMNRTQTYSILCNTNGQQIMRVLLQIMQKSGENIKLKAITLLSTIFYSILKQIHNVQDPIRLFQGYKETILRSNIKEFLHKSLRQEQLFLMLRQGLSSSSIQIKYVVLEIVEQLLHYTLSEQQQQEDMEIQKGISLQDFVSLLSSFNIVSLIENEQLHGESQNITMLAHEILEMFDCSHSATV